MSKAWIWKLHTGEATVKQLANDLAATDPLTVRVRDLIVQDLVKMLSSPSTLPQPTFGLVMALLGEMVARGLAKPGPVSDNMSTPQPLPMTQPTPSPWPSNIAPSPVHQPGIQPPPPHIPLPDAQYF